MIQLYGMPEEMKETWEYQVVKVDGFPTLVNAKTLEDRMNTLGVEGYECFQVISGSNCNILLFKRKR